jgi:hypothetical protein
VDVRFSCFNLFFIGTQEGYAVFFFRKRKRTKNPLASGPAVPFSVNGQYLGLATAAPKKSMPIEKGNGGFISFFIFLSFFLDSR